MSSVMVCIVGQQPVPNILPVKHCKPTHIVLVYSDDTKSVYKNLKSFFESQNGHYRITVEEGVMIDPYDLVAAYDSLKRLYVQLSRRHEKVLFNITGGTKPMSFAGFLVAQEANEPLLYLDSRGRNILYYYRFKSGVITLDKIEEVSEEMSIREYLQAHGFWKCEPKNPQEDFERQLAEVLREHVSEIWCSVNLDSVEMDIIVRINNAVGVIQAKTGKKAEKIDGIYNLNTVANSNFLGSHTKRFLITSRCVGTNNKRLAQQQRIKVIELLSYESDGTLSNPDKDQLRREVVEELSK